MKTRDTSQNGETAAETLISGGYAITDAGNASAMREALIDTAFEDGCPGKRCLLNRPAVAETAKLLRRHLVSLGLMTTRSVAIQAIAFDKMTATNWKVAWHQDLMFPFAKPVTSPGFETPGMKDGVAFARPPLQVLEDLLAVRLHLDNCGATNGPLRISPGTHRLGVIPSSEVGGQVARHGQIVCHPAAGQCLLMRPLLLHASCKATEPNHRRVLHFVFHSGSPIPESWALVV